MRSIYILLLAACFASCSSNEVKEEKKQEAPVTASDAPAPVSPDMAPAPSSILPSFNELAQNGVNDITGFYGGVCTFSKGEAKGKKYIKVEVSKSASLDSNRQITELHLSNIAALFYTNVASERNKLNEVHSVINFGDGKNAEKTYSIEQLEQVLHKMIVVQQLIGFLKDKKYDALTSILNDKSLITYNKILLIEKVKAAEQQLGNIKDFMPYGFMFIKTADGKDLIHISGVLIRDKQNNEFSMDFDPKSDKNEAVFLNYKL